MDEKTVVYEHVNCDLCGGNEYLNQYRKPDNWLWVNQFEYPVVKCCNCGLVFVNPRPTQETMSLYYPINYHDKRDDEMAQKRYKRQIDFLPELKHERILDIGCARGDFLAYLINRYPDIDVFGCDYFSNHVNDKRINFQKALLTECNYSKESFDLVTAWAVFEHLHKPSVYFEEVSRILKKRGKFVFLVTNSESIYGKWAYCEDVPRHTYHFSQSVLSKYAEKYGFKLTKCIYNDELFDGRGKGLFSFSIGALMGVKWENRYFSSCNLFQKIGIRFGSILDSVVFFTHWEAQLKQSGIMIVEYEKC